MASINFYKLLSIIINSFIIIKLMHESDEMFTKLIARFGAKALEKKKEKDFMKHLAAKVD